MTLKELMKDLSWIKTDELEDNENCVYDFINTFELNKTKFEKIQKKIACVYMNLTTIDKENYVIVLQQNYTEEEFVDFLKKLNIDTPIEYGTGTVWSKKGNYIWHYENMFGHGYALEWIETSIPAIHKDCKRKKDK